MTQWIWKTPFAEVLCAIVAAASVVSAQQPAPDLILAAMEKLNVQSSRACYVGDSIFDEKAAHMAGVLFIGYKRPGDISIRHFAELQKLIT